MIVDLGTFDWSSLPALANYHRFNEMAFTARLRKEVFRETGCCLSPYHAYLQCLGLETLALRMDRTCENALAVAEFLETRNMVKALRYPGLASSSFYGLSRKQFNGRFGGIMTFELPDKAASFRFLNNLSLVKRTPNLGDNKTLALHPASTIFAGFTDEEQKSLGVGDSMIRLSIGIEDPEDIINDIQEALRGI
jgi:O-acetylhomoserine (thiol)-lyase